MCFSPTASFVGSAVLFVTGIATLKIIKGEKKKLLVALFPLIFALHQFIEGWIWVFLKEGPVHLTLIHFLQYFYMFIALMWPVYTPVALFFLEKQAFRKKIYVFLIGLSLIYACTLFYLFLNVKSPFPMVTVCDHSLDYYSQIFVGPSKFIVYIIYLLNTAFASLISSFPFMWIFGIAIGLGLVLAHIFYFATQYSVWCFFGACCSIIIYFILKYSRKR